MFRLAVELESSDVAQPWSQVFPVRVALVRRRVLVALQVVGVNCVDTQQQHVVSETVPYMNNLFTPGFQHYVSVY